MAEGGITVLHLDGSPGTYAETPAIPILTTDFTISVWIKLVEFPRSHQAIYGDWSSNASFAFAVYRKGQLCAIAKRRPPATDHVFLICKE